MITILVYRDGKTTRAETVDPAWLDEGSGVTLWVDIAAPTPEESRLLADTFKFHELAIEDALAEVHHPKLEAYDGYLYVILHGIDFKASQHEFATHDADFFAGPNYLVTVHGRHVAVDSGDAGAVRAQYPDDGRGPDGADAPHRRHDGGSLPARSGQAGGADRQLEETVFDVGESRATNQEILELKRDVASLRRIILPQRDVLGRLGRREFPQISEEIAYRFRDVYDHVVRISDDALLFHDRLSAILEAHLSNVSNRLNEVMKFLTIFSVIFMPMTVLTGHVRDERAASCASPAASTSSSGGSSASWRPCPAC